ncbi:MAG: DNA polymerase III subunit delta [Gemmatimonadales bacterium]
MPQHSLSNFYGSLKRNGPETAYYLYGTEDILKEEALGKLLEGLLDPGLRDFNLDRIQASQVEPETLADLCNTLPMMADRRVVIITGIEAWKRKTRAKTAAVAYLSNPAPETVLIMVQSAGEEKVDKDLSGAAYTVDCHQLTPEKTLDWLNREGKLQGVAFAPGAADHLIAVVGGDLGAMRSEVAKLAGLSPDGPATVELIGSLVGIRHGETVWDWRDAVLGGNPSQSLAMIEPILNQSGMTAVRMLTTLGASLVGLGVARSHYDGGKRGRALESAVHDSLRAARLFWLRIPNWRVEATKWASWAPDWPEPRIRAAIDAARMADERLKNTKFSKDLGVLTDLVMRLATGLEVTA